MIFEVTQKRRKLYLLVQTQKDKRRFNAFFTNLELFIVFLEWSSVLLASSKWEVTEKVKEQQERGILTRQLNKSLEESEGKIFFIKTYINFTN